MTHREPLPMDLLYLSVSWPAKRLAPSIRQMWFIYVISFLFLLCFRVRLFIDALWSPAGKGLTSWLSFVMSNCEVVTFPLVSLVRCRARLYRFLIFALFLTLNPWSHLKDLNYLSSYFIMIYFSGQWTIEYTLPTDLLYISFSWSAKRLTPSIR